MGTFTLTCFGFVAGRDVDTSSPSNAIKVGRISKDHLESLWHVGRSLKGEFQPAAFCHVELDRGWSGSDPDKTTVVGIRNTALPQSRGVVNCRIGDATHDHIVQGSPLKDFFILWQGWLPNYLSWLNSFRFLWAGRDKRKRDKLGGLLNKS